MLSRVAFSACLLVALALVSSACRFDGLSFREDDRLEIIAPEDRAEVKLPVTVRWVVRDNLEAASFVAFIDRAPQPPGEGLDHFLKYEAACRGEALKVCLQPDRLAERMIFQTTERQITLNAIPRRIGVSKAEENRHEITVALLDSAGRRIGEAGWTVTFTLATE